MTGSGAGSPDPPPPTPPPSDAVRAAYIGRGGAIVAALIAAVGAVVVAVIGLAPKDGSTPPPTAAPPASSSTNAVPASATPAEPTSSDTKVEIRSPAEGDAIDTPALVSGVGRPLHAGNQLWVMVQVPSADNRYYPHSEQLAVDPVGAWSAYVSIGDASNAGQPYALHIVELEPVAVARFQAYIKNEMKTHQAIGFTKAELQNLNVAFVASISVSRR